MATASMTTPPLGWKAEDFDLEGTDGKHYRLGDLKGPKGTLVMFICNHCPYVQAVLDDIIADHLLVAGSPVAHVMGEGKIEAAKLTPGAVVAGDGRLVYPAEQRDMGF